MEKIPAKDRFSKHAKISEVSPETLNDAISRFGLSPQECEVRLLAGGFMNANFIVACGDKKFVFRVYSTDKSTAEREKDVLQFLRSYPVKVPQVFASFEAHGRPITVLEYIDGITLEDKILSGEPIEPHLYVEIGRQLAQIHSIHFGEAGFIGPKLTIGKEYEDFNLFIRQYVENTLNEIPAERLDTNTRDSLRKLLEDKWPLILQTEPLRQLVHTDFNPKNILVSKGQNTKVLAILDWEFCLSGNGLIDLGNFFRFSYDYSPDTHQHFENGYRSVNGQLAPDWIDTRLLLDLGNMCSFLVRKEDYPQSFRTARVVIKSTLDHFGY
jgi:aminoglycoside phosphotransferase (APT) family kinase protein